MSDSQHILEAPPGYRSREAALFVAQMEDQSRRLTEDTRDLASAELEWQPAPGLNTIGMLLAHIAIVEVFWTQIGPLGLGASRCSEVLGIGEDDDGMPLPPGAPAPETLRGKDLAFFDRLLARAREHTRSVATGLTYADLDRQVVRKRRDGSTQTINVRWVLYHMLEHEAGHYGQINLLRHQFRVLAGAAAGRRD